MKIEEIIYELKNYQSELGEILSRFKHTREAISIDNQDNYRLRSLTTELVDLLHDHVTGSAPHIRMITDSYNHGISNFYNSSSYSSVKEIRGFVDAIIIRIERNPKILSESVDIFKAGTTERELLNALDGLIIRFHAVAVQLRSRHNERPTLDINDEYDVQDLMHALLRIHFNDVRPEEWVPSYAGSASRTDFLLPEIDTVIEIKKTRNGLNSRSVGEQLIVDIKKYKKHPQCRRLICFVYDPEGRIANPAGIESDLNNDEHGIDVHVFILPKVSG